MKTQQEIEKMKWDLTNEIQSLETLISVCFTESEFIRLCDRKRQRQAQYNILLEVLK